MEQQESVQQAQGNGMAVAAMVCGIVGVVLAIIPCTFWIGGPLGIIALVLGLVAKKAPGGEGMAISGIVTGIVAIVIAAVWLIAWAKAANEAEDFQQEFGRALQQGLQEAQRQQQRQAPKQFLDFDLKM